MEPSASPAAGNRRTVAILWLLPMLVLTLLLASLVWQQWRDELPLDDADYVAVLLNTGIAYYGHPHQRTRTALVLTETHYIRQVQGENEQVSNVLMRRGQELHQPTRMLIPLASIQFIEPVAPGSEIAVAMRNNRPAAD
ncbi:MAG: hypothetical protein EA400_00820 [Chromatiaceae bacterium]|nr:MAG: hypothetical protein EA400_00820 [Chromatiaceae bacterium]